MKLKLIVAIVALLTLGTAAKTSGQSSETPADNRIDAVFSSVTSPNAPGLAVLVRKNGHAVFERGYGVRDLHSKTKIDTPTNFRLASFTKQFTAMAIMLLVHDGKLRYDETLAEIFPDFPVYGKSITIRNLLNHTSGLPDYEDLMESVEKTKGAIWTPEKQIQDAEVLELLKKEKNGKFAPGENWAYSNSGYVLLGLIVAKVLGKSYGEFLHEKLFAPLKMNHTIVFQKGKNEIVNRDALRNHTLLSEKEFQLALTPVRLADGSEPHWPVEANDDNLHPRKPVAYGFGWFLDPYQGRQRMWHTGTTMGFRTVIERFTEGDGLTVIILCNRTDLGPEKLALQVVDIFLSTKN